MWCGIAWHMAERADPGPDAPEPGTNDDSIEAYETNGAVVLYDARNPLAWIESTAAVRIDEAT